MRLRLFLLIALGFPSGFLVADIERVSPIYQPTNSTDELLSRYSQVHSRQQDYWQLTDEEWSRYEEIKTKSPWASWENNASPLAILFHYATSQVDKRRYARIEAELDTWRQHAVVEFQTLYDKERAIVHQRYVDAVQHTLPTLDNIRPHDALRLFVNVDTCDPRCRSVVARAIATSARLDIYVVGAKEDDEIFRWATSAAIPIERVKTKEITLNHENNLLQIVVQQQGIPQPVLPALFKALGDQLQVVVL